MSQNRRDPIRSARETSKEASRRAKKARRGAVLADNERQLDTYVYPGSFPSLLLLGEDMTIAAYDRYDYKPALEALLE